MGLLSSHNVTSSEHFRHLRPASIAQGMGPAHHQAQRAHPTQYTRSVLPALRSWAATAIDAALRSRLIRDGDGDGDGDDGPGLRWVVDLTTDHNEALWWVRQLDMVEYDPVVGLAPDLQRAFITATLGAPSSNQWQQQQKQGQGQGQGLPGGWGPEEEQEPVPRWDTGLAITNHEAARIASDRRLSPIRDSPTKIIWATVLPREKVGKNINHATTAANNHNNNNNNNDPGKGKGKGKGRAGDEAGDERRRPSARDDKQYHSIEAGLGHCLRRATAADTRLRQLLITSSGSGDGNYHDAHRHHRAVSVPLLLDEYQQAVDDSVEWMRACLNALLYGCDAATREPV